MMSFEQDISTRGSRKTRFWTCRRVGYEYMIQVIVTTRMELNVYGDRKDWRSDLPECPVLGTEY